MAEPEILDISGKLLILYFTNDELKGAFTHPVYACVYRTALRFFITYLGFVDIYGKKVITLKTQRSAENACGNWMWQLSFNGK